MKCLLLINSPPCALPGPGIDSVLIPRGGHNLPISDFRFLNFKFTPVPLSQLPET